MIIIRIVMMFVLCIIFPICIFGWFLAMIWMLTPFSPLKIICHNFLGWHKPGGKYRYCSIGVKSKCKICGCDIVSDGAGGWKKINYSEDMTDEQD